MVHKQACKNLNVQDLQEQPAATSTTLGMLMSLLSQSGHMSQDQLDYSRQSSHRSTHPHPFTCRVAGIFAAGAQDLKRSDPNEGQAEIYALQIADTVIVQPSGATPEVVTSTATKSWADVAYYFKVSSLLDCL